jgi:hypothetical protein
MPNDQFQYIKLPDGSYGKFAADATDDQIRASVSKDFPDAYPASTPSLLSKANEFAGKALNAAGLPTSISDIPDWAKRLTGTAPDSKPFWQPAVDAVKQPTQENIVGAVPFVGPAAVSMSHDVRGGNYSGAAGTLFGTLAAPAAASQVSPGMRAARAELIDATRTPEGALRPGVQAAATTAGTAAGGAIGHLTGFPELATGGAVGGAFAGKSLADALLPTRSAPLDFRGGAYTEFDPAETVSKMSASPNAIQMQAARAALLRDAKAQAGIPTIGSPQQESGYTPSVTRVPIRPEPSSPLTPESVPGPDTSGKGNLLSPLARQGDPRAAQELLRRGRRVLFVPDDSTGSMSAQDFADLLKGLQ